VQFIHTRKMKIMIWKEIKAEKSKQFTDYHTFIVLNSGESIDTVYWKTIVFNSEESLPTGFPYYMEIDVK
jgi:hypothetical protein